MVPDLVPCELVAHAVALNSVAFNVARAVGPALGGLLVAAAGAGWAFLINSLSFLAVIVAVARLHWSEPPSPRSPRWHRPSGSGPLRQVHATLPSPPGGGGDVRSDLRCRAVAAGHAHRGEPRCRGLRLRRVARGDGGRALLGAFTRVPPPSGWQSVMSGWRSPPSDWPVSPWASPRGLAGGGRPLHRRDRLGVDLGDSQRHRPVARPGGSEAGRPPSTPWPSSASSCWELYWQARSGRPSEPQSPMWCWGPEQWCSDWLSQRSTSPSWGR